MFMRVNSKCAHQVRPPLPPGYSGARSSGKPWPTTRDVAGSRVQPMTPPAALWPTAPGCASATTSVGREDYFSRTIVNEPGRAAGCMTHPAFSVTRQPSPCRVVPSSGPVTGTDSVDPSAERKTPPFASRRPH